MSFFARKCVTGGPGLLSTSDENASRSCTLYLYIEVNASTITSSLTYFLFITNSHAHSLTHSLTHWMDCAMNQVPLSSSFVRMCQTLHSEHLSHSHPHSLTHSQRLGTVLSNCLTWFLLYLMQENENKNKKNKNKKEGQEARRERSSSALPNCAS